MKVVILAGGLGTRLAEETSERPKPMVEIGSRPILWHIMSIYAHHGFKEFVIACGYKGEMIKSYFQNYYLNTSNLIIDLKSGCVEKSDSQAPDWKISLIDTGLHTMTGGRLKRLQPWLGNETFQATYGDGLSSVDINKVGDFHRRHGKLATVTAVRPPARFGELVIEDGKVHQFAEKPQTGEGWINGGFFVFEPGVFEYLSGDDCILERQPLEKLAQDGELMAFKHDGFWQPMDTLRDKQHLVAMWESGTPPWKTW